MGEVDPGLLAAMQASMQVVSTRAFYNQTDSGFDRVVVCGSDDPASAPAQQGQAEAQARAEAAPASTKPCGVYYEQKGKGFVKVRLGTEEGEARKKESLARLRSKGLATQQLKHEEVSMSACHRHGL